MKYGKVFLLRNGIITRHITDHERWDCATEILFVPPDCPNMRTGELPRVGDVINLLNPPPIEGSALPETGALWVGGRHGTNFDVMMELGVGNG